MTSILWVLALDEYDQVLLEGASQNRLMESLVLFDSVINSRWFLRTSVILFLNKIDLFKQKLGRSPLGNYFPDYSGGDDVNKAAKYILWRFNQVNRAHANIYPQYVYKADSRCSRRSLHVPVSHKLQTRRIYGTYSRLFETPL